MFWTCFFLCFGFGFIELELIEQRVEALEVGFPDATMFLEPFGGVCEGLGFHAAGPALSVLAAGDEAGALENFKVFGDGRLSHGEGLGEFVDGGFAGGEAGEDGTASGIGEGGESGVESIGRGHCITVELYNHLVIYKMERDVKPGIVPYNR